MNEWDIRMIHFLYRQCELTIDAIEAGDTKRAIILLRRVLPSGYRHSFVKENMPVDKVQTLTAPKPISTTLE